MIRPCAGCTITDPRRLLRVRGYDAEREAAGLADVAIDGADGIDGIVVVPFIELDGEGQVGDFDRCGRALELALARGQLRVLRSQAAAIFRSLPNAKLKLGRGEGPIPILAVGALSREFDVEASHAI